MERMSALDSAFLHVETSESSLHIASLGLFEGPVPQFAEVRNAIARKLPRLPRYRQRVQRLPLGLGRPVWLDDEDFDIDDHVLVTSVASPGGTRELQEVVDWLMSLHLELDRPLWETWMITGLENGRWGLVTKVHHSMVDGIAGTDLLSTVLDHSAEGDPPPGEDGWRPARAPGTLALLGAHTRQAAAERTWQAVDLALQARQPGRLARSVARRGRGLLGFGAAALPTGASPLIGPLGRDRSYRWTSVSILDVLEIKQHSGATINDIVLAGLAGGYRALLEGRGIVPGRDAIRTLVPVSVRHADERGRLDNRVSAILLDLPVEIADPHDRLTEVSIRMRRLKDSHEPEAGELVTDIGDALPAPLLAAGLHLFFRLPHRHLTTVTTNVPGPRGQLFLLGRRMLATYPYVPIADRVRLSIAVTSYDQDLLIGVTADRDSVPDVDVLVRGIDRGFTQLLKATQALEVQP